MSGIVTTPYDSPILDGTKRKNVGRTTNVRNSRACTRYRNPRTNIVPDVRNTNAPSRHRRLITTVVYLFIGLNRARFGLPEIDTYFLTTRRGRYGKKRNGPFIRDFKRSAYAGYWGVGEEIDDLEPRNARGKTNTSGTTIGSYQETGNIRELETIKRHRN